jgi:hypothetical protein
MSEILFPALFLEQWRFYLADPIKHWETGYSAKALAHCWYEANGFPKSVSQVFENAGEPFIGLKPLLILPEHKVSLPGGRTCSQSDIWILARNKKEMFSIAVEGKVNESFDKSIKEWFKKESDGRNKRFTFLTEILEKDIPRDSQLRYQLLHRTASAILEAERFGAEHAMLMVHSFSPNQPPTWFDDFSAFVKLWGIKAELNHIYSTCLRSGCTLHFTWIQGEEQYLER